MAKRGSGTDVTEAPPEWLAILRDAVEKPGTFDAAFRNFHNYSVGNMLLALQQCAERGIEPGPMASFKRWLELGRVVRKGEKALKLCIPRTMKTARVDKSTGEEEQVTFVRFIFRPATFVFGQTQPLEGQEDRSDVLLEPVGDWSFDAALVALNVRQAPFSDVRGNMLAYFQPETRTIHINPMAPDAKHSAIHELAHSILHKGGYHDADSKGVAEFEAEATNLIVSEVLGIGNADNSRGYCQRWLARAGQDDISDKSAQKIMSAADKILKAGRNQVKQREEAA